MQTLESLIEQAGDLPSLPEVYIKVTELLGNEDSSGIKIGEAVQSDPALTARILKMINSAYYGLQNEVTSVPQAVSLLGRHQLQQVLLGSVLVDVVREFEISDFPLRDFWEHCIKTAIIARHLALQNASVIDHEAFFTAGLLHDIGWLVIAKVKPGSYVQVMELAKTHNSEVLLVETKTLGVTHIDVGVALLEKWDIPALITECVKRHHDGDYAGPLSLETGIIFLANKLSRFNLPDHVPQGEREEEAISEILEAIPNWEKSKCTLAQIAVACRLAEEQWFEAMDSLGMGDLEIDDSHEETFRFETALRKP